MTDYRPSPDGDPEPLALGERLAALRLAFVSLAAQVRDRVAAILGAAIADAVRQAARAWLGGGAGPGRPAAHSPRPRSGDTEPDYWAPDEPDDDLGDDFDGPPAPPPRPALPARLAGAALAGWQAARLWLTHRGPRPAWPALAVGAAAGLGALLLGPLAAAALPALAAVLLADGLAGL